MLNVLSRSLIASAVLISLAGAVQAATVTYQVGQGPAGLALQAAPGKFVFSQGSTFDGVNDYTIGGGVAVLGVLAAVPTPLDGSTLVQQTVPASDPVDPPVPVDYQVGLKVASVSYDDQTDALQQIGLSGGYKLTGRRISGVLAGGSLSVTDLRVDLGLGVVTADIVGTRLSTSATPGETFSLSDVALWSFDQIVGPATFSPETLPSASTYSASYQIGALRLTADGKEALRRSLGVVGVGLAAVNSIDTEPTGFASLSANVVFAPVPEPGAYALAIGGLAVVGALGAARRRQG